MTPCPVKHPCFFWAGCPGAGLGVALAGLVLRVLRVLWPPTSRLSPRVRPFGPVLRTASGGKAFPPCPPRVIMPSRVRRVPIGERPLLGPSPREWTPASRYSVRACPSVDGLHPSDPAIGFASLAPCRGAIEVESLRLPPDGHTCPGASRRGLCPPPPSPRAGPAIGAMRSPLEGQRHGQGSTSALRPGNTCRGSAPAPGPAGRALWHGTRGGRARDESIGRAGAAGLDDGGRLELGGQWARWAERQHPGDAPGVGRDNRSRSRGEVGRPP
jgi:hypothetical protein